MVTVVFNPGDTSASKYSALSQYDYGQVLRIQGLNLPAAVEIDFALQPTGGTSVPRIGITKDGVTDVVIPDSMLENNDSTDGYSIYAFVFLTDATSGQTEYRITLGVTARPKPEVPGGGDDPNIFHEAVQAVREAAEQAAESEKQAEGWAHGREDLPERAEDNARYYAEKAEKTAMEVPGQVQDAKEEIDRYVQGKEEELKGDTGNVYFAAFKVVNGRLQMYSDPEFDKVEFIRIRSRMFYRLHIGGKHENGK